MQTRPNAAFLRSVSSVDYIGLGYPLAVAPDPDPLEFRVAAAVAYVEQITGRIPLETTVPADLWPIAQEAVRMRAEQATIQAGADYVSDASDDLLQSFSAGSYCVPMDSEALTPGGWRTYADLCVGDSLLGFDPATGMTRWTAIKDFVRPFEADVVEFGNAHWRLRCTPEHRWMTWVERGGERSFKLVSTQDMKWGVHPILTAPAATTCGLPVTAAEAALVAWLYTDGHVTRRGEVPAYAHPPLCDGMTECVVCGASVEYGGRGVPRRFCGACKASRRAETKHPLMSAMVFQSHYPEAVEQVLADASAPHGILPTVAPNGTKGLRYKLASRWADDLWRRAGLDKGTLSHFVLKLGEAEREAFLEAGLLAEGHVQRSDANRRTDSGAWYGWHFAQNRGETLDAFVLAAHLSGYAARPWETKARCSGFRLGRADHHAKNLDARPAGRATVWCPTTELGTWTMRQGTTIALTGNSETRKSGGASGASSKAFRVLNSNAALAELLWLLMTPEMRAYWEAVYRGENAPAWGVTEEYWDPDNVPNYSYGYGSYPYTW